MNNAVTQKSSAMRTAIKPFVLPLVLSAAWCLALLLLYQRNASNEEAHATELARLQARTLSEQMLDTRAWNSAHGGVYVRESEYGAANPWIPENMRRVELVGGERLVLVNPAYMSRQIAQRSADRGARLRITSHRPLRPDNLADTWEQAALLQISGGAPEVFALRNEAENKEDFRYMAPLRTEAACLQCHASSIVGDVRGGISVTLDAEPFLQAAHEHRALLGYIYGVTGLSGVLGIGGLSFAFNRRRVLAEQKAAMKDAFLANMSHDMRTPLTGIIGMTDLLRRDATPEVRRRACAYLQSASRALLEMITDITEHAALDTGKTECLNKPFVLKKSLENCLELFRPGCEEKMLDFRLEIAPGMPATLIGDEFRLRQALGNLVGNAVKFTEQGHVLVRVSGEREDDGRFLLRLEVEDTGPGIPPQEMERIFERFAQGSENRRKGIPGTGLGLTISRDLARLMGGKLRAVDAPGPGSTFILTLRCPLPEEDIAPAEKINASAGCVEAAPAGSLRIVLAEDNRAVAYFMRQVLEEDGHDVRAAHNGLDALALLAQCPADMAILDVRMPGLDGPELIRRIRNGACGIDPTLPVLSVTATLSADLRNELERLGRTALMEKPFSAARLIDAVRALAKDMLPLPRERTEADAARCFDAEAALAAVNGDSRLLHTLAEVFLEELPAFRAALEEAAAGNPENLRLPAHALKNSAGMLRLDALRTACAALENAALRGEDTDPPRLKLERALVQAEHALRGGLHVRDHNSMPS